LTINGRRIPAAAIGLFVIIIVAVVISVLVSLMMKSPDSRADIQFMIQQNVFQRNVTFDKMYQTDSCKLALDWILYQDDMQLNATDFSIYQR
jgi:type II secretory pathway pseudopilin PulG